MPDMITLRELISTFSEEELDFTVPFDFKNPTTETLPYALAYNEKLGTDYLDAQSYREENSEILEPMIFDAKAANRFQALLINSYLFSKAEKAATNTSYDNTDSGIDADTVQEAIDDIILNGGTSQEVTMEEYQLLDAAGEVRPGTTYYITDEDIGYDGYSIKEVSALPSDAADHPKTIYLIVNGM